MKKYLIPATTFLILGACATRGAHEGTHRGSVVMKMENGEAHVCLGNTQVQTGDSVTLIRHECKSRRLGGKNGGVDIECTPKTLGVGTVVKVYDQHYSVAKFPEDLGFKEGDIVEKTAAQTQ